MGALNFGRVEGRGHSRGEWQKLRISECRQAPVPHVTLCCAACCSQPAAEPIYITHSPNPSTPAEVLAPCCSPNWSCTGSSAGWGTTGQGRKKSDERGGCDCQPFAHGTLQYKRPLLTPPQHKGIRRAARQLAVNMQQGQYAAAGSPGLPQRCLQGSGRGKGSREKE